MIPNIQILRGIAALLVVLAHLPEQLDDHGLDNIFPNTVFGVFGVDLFFVISGFIMVFATGPDRGPHAAVRFLVRRIIRIVPLYWIFTTIFMGIAWRAVRHTGLPADEIRHIVASYLFIPSAEPTSGDFYPTYQLGWTLNYEMFFYACFTLVLLAPRKATVPTLAILFVGLVIVGTVVELPLPLSYWGRSQILEFVFGMAVAEACLSGWRIPLKAAVPLIIAAIIAVPLFIPYIDDWDVLRGLAWGVPAAAIVACTVLAPLPRPSLVSRSLEALGDISYSLYLVHYAFFVGTGYLLRNVLARREISAPIYAVMLFAGSIGAALLLYHLVERPLTRGLRRLVSDKPPVVPARLPGAAETT